MFAFVGAFLRGGDWEVGLRIARNRSGRDRQCPTALDAPDGERPPPVLSGPGDSLKVQAPAVTTTRRASRPKAPITEGKRRLP
ncbi:hypothetical protein A5756_06255 [Mycobacterium sp. 852002-53434_SCH5985345]|nr:hypothetical protein A5756_06255 [Mycobacterium sp. 852002-53434_SCH5985345]